MTHVKRTKDDQERFESRVLQRLCCNKLEVKDPKAPKGKKEVDCDNSEYRNAVCRSCDIKQIDQVLREQTLTPSEFVEYEAELIRKGYRAARGEVKKIRNGEQRQSVSKAIARKVSRRAI